MVDFKTRVFSEDEGQIIGAEVLVYNDQGERMGSIEVVNAEDLEALQEILEEIPETYVSSTDLTSILTNTNEDTVINATTLSGFNSSNFSKTNHTHQLSEITAVEDMVVTYEDDTTETFQIIVKPNTNE